MLDWSTDLEATIAKNDELKQFLLARDGDRDREYATVPFKALREVVTASPDTAFYEVVQDGKCFLHIVVHLDATEDDVDARLASVVEAMRKALPDIPLQDMLPQLSLGGIPAKDGAAGELVLRVVYRDVVLGSLAANKAIAENVAVLLDGPGSVQLGVYEHGHCSLLMGRLSANTTAEA